MKHLLFTTAVASVLLGALVIEQRSRLRQCAAAQRLADAGWTIMYISHPLLGQRPSLISNLNPAIQRYIPITEQDVKTVANMPGLHTIRFGAWALNGADGGIYDENLRELQSLRLDKLVVSSPNITSEGLESVAEMASLRQVEVGGAKITEADLDLLKTALPRAQVKWAQPILNAP